MLLGAEQPSSPKSNNRGRSRSPGSPRSPKGPEARGASPKPAQATDVKKEKKKRKGPLEREKEEQAKQAREALKGKIALACLMGVFFLCPTVILFIQSGNDTEDCNENVAECKAKCVQVFSEVKRTWASQLIPEKECIRTCASVGETCLQTADTVQLAGFLLLGAMALTLALIWMVTSMMGSLEDDAAELALKKPRPAYAEPTFTEEDKMRKIEDNAPKDKSQWPDGSKEIYVVSKESIDLIMKVWKKDGRQIKEWLISRTTEQLFQLEEHMDKYGSYDLLLHGRLFPIPREHIHLATRLKMPMTTARCLDCQLDVEVGFGWLPQNDCSSGGLTSGICPRCREVVVGIL